MADDTTERLATALRGDMHNARPFAIFDECDADRDGLISSDDFAAGLRRLGLDMDDPAATPRPAQRRVMKIHPV